MKKQPNPCSKNLRAGEIVRVRSSVGMFPEITCRVEGTYAGMASFSVGEIEFGGPLAYIEVLGREPAEKYNVLDEQIRFLENQVTTHDCADCRRQLEKLRKRKAEGEIIH